MITIIAYDPAFGAAHNLRVAFSLWEETRLITLDTHKYWPGAEDIILIDENRTACRQLIEASRFTVIAGASCLQRNILPKLAGRAWKAWAKKQRWIPFWTDTPYWHEPERYNNLMSEIGTEVIFAMMDLLRLAPQEAVPLCHPQADLGPSDKPDWLTVIHSPRTAKKRSQKGSDRIERIMTRICQEFNHVDYQAVMDVSHQECLQIKQDARIVIDQMPDSGLPAGLGRSGEEGLVAGAVVLTSLNGQDRLKGHFPSPPVIPVYDEDNLYQEVRRLCRIDRAELEAVGQEGRAWAEQYLLFPGWLDYVGQFIR